MSILSDNQKRILSLLSKEKVINDNFYLSGGTALAEFYLNHRLSEKKNGKIFFVNEAKKLSAGELE